MIIALAQTASTNDLSLLCMPTAIFTDNLTKS